MKSSFRTRKAENTLIGTRLQLLLLKQETPAKDCSPTLKDLRENKPNRVQKFLELFEKKPWGAKIGVNWWIDGASPDVLAPKDASIFIFPTQQSRNNDGKLMEELLRMEDDHIREVCKLIESTKAILRGFVGFVAMRLNEHKFCLFGDLDAIWLLHMSIIRPEIAKALDDENCINFVKALVQLIDDGKLYCYVSHKMQEKMIMKLCSEYLHSKIYPYVLYKMLGSYKNWINEVCNELITNTQANADKLAVCFDAERKILKLMETVADAEAVSNISQIFDVPLEIQFKVFDIVKKREQMTKPILLLIPKKTYKLGYRYPVRSEFQLMITSHFISLLFS